jgi:hypothetical protein
MSDSEKSGGLRPGWQPGQSGNPKGRPQGKPQPGHYRCAGGDGGRRRRDRPQGGGHGQGRRHERRAAGDRKTGSASEGAPDLSDAAGDEYRRGIAQPLRQAILQAVAAGDLLPGEGTTLAGIVEARRKAVETLELEQRISALETRK